MPLSTGDKLGHYEIIAPLGTGGMGEVYKARDLQLEREVAIKVLPHALARDPERLARFDREAKILAALNHPNIAVIYGLAGSEDQRALVMELVPGDTLGARIQRAALPLEEALQVARQIAEALEAAHEKGVTHRDLKPGNVMITPSGLVKVLDFGLAAMSQPSSAHDPNNSPTLTMGMTQTGAIMGTAAYMSPEQAAGSPVDRRADIWSYGVVLYEMLGRKRLFKGDTVAHILADVLREPIDFDRLTAPAPILNLLRRCLDRDVKNRLQAIGEARVAIQKYLANPESAVPGVKPERTEGGSALWGRLAWILAGVGITAALALGFVHFRERPPIAEVLRFQIEPPENSSFNYHMVLSPDGRRGAFIAPVPGGGNQIWVRSLDSLDPRTLTGTDGPGQNMFWSPDSRFIAFEQQGRLRKVEATGGPPQTICDFSGNSRGGAWSTEGVIVFGTTAGLWRVPAAGGTPTQLAALDPNETQHEVGVFLRDQKHFLFRRTFQDAEKRGLYLGSLDFSKEQQGAKLILATGQHAAYVPNPDDSGSGFLLFLREGQLTVQPFDDSKLELTGEATPIAEDVGNSFQMGYFSASMNGLLAFRRGAAGGSAQYTWYDRQGKNLGVALGRGSYSALALSSDGTRVVGDRTTSSQDVWLLELASGVSTQFTFDSARDQDPVWSPDGSHIAFASARGTNTDLYQKVSTGAGNDELLLKFPQNEHPKHWSPDGKYLLFQVSDPKTGNDLMALPMTDSEKDRTPVAIIATEANEDQGQFSPDSKWVAYRSNATGRNEIYVQPFPATGAKWRVSNSGGVQPRWNRNGKELFYIAADGKLASVEVNTAGGTLKNGTPQPLFDPRILGGGTVNGSMRWDLTPDAKKFLFITSVMETGASPITLVSNWPALLK